jgi:dynein heavy chain
MSADNKKSISKRPDTTLFDFERGEIEHYDLPFAKAHLRVGKKKKKKKNLAVVHRTVPNPESTIAKQRKERRKQAAKLNTPDLLSIVRKTNATEHINDFDDPTDLIESVKTGEDAIAFFALHGDQSPVKFIHFNSASASSKLSFNFRPYDLVRVAPKKVNAEHYIMSSAGLVHVVNNDPSNFIPLPEWTRESTLFNVVGNIRFFKNYLLMKSFLMWNTFKKYRVYCRKRDNLEQSFFLARHTFCEPLPHVQANLTEIHSVPLMDLEKLSQQKPYPSEETSEIENFSAVQSKSNQNAAKILEVVVEKAYGIVKKVCESAIVTMKKFDEEPLEGDSLDNKQRKSKSIVVLKREAAARRNAHAVAVKEYGLLCNFIRLVDYMVVQNVVHLAVGWHVNFLEMLGTIRDRCGLLEIAVTFTDIATEFTPNLERVLAMMTKLTGDTKLMLDSIPRIVYTPPFKFHIMNVVTDAPRVSDIVHNSKEYVDSEKVILNTIHSDFQRASSYTEQFDIVRPIYDDYQQWDHAGYQQKDHTVESLKSDLERLALWDDNLDRNLRPQHVLGVLYVETRNLKKTLRPLLDEIEGDVKGYLKHFAFERCSAVLMEFQTRLGALNKEPQTLKQFAEYVKKMTELAEQDTEVVAMVNKIDDLQAIIEKHNVKLSAEHSVLLKEIDTIQDIYRARTQQSNEFKSSQIKAQIQDLKIRIQGVEERCSEEEALLTQGEYEDPENFSNPAVVFEHIERTEKALGKIELQVERYREYCQVLKVPEFDFTNFASLNKSFNLRKDLWAKVDAWQSLQQNTMTADFRENVKAEELEKLVAIASKEAFSYDKKISNSITHLLREQTTVFKRIMPVILDLGNPAMDPRHWTQIFNEIGFDGNPRASFCLQELKNHGIFQPEYADFVSDISGTASGERQLTASLNEVKESWAALNFTVLNYRDQRSIFILGGLEEVFLQLEDNMVGLQSMLGSRFVMSMREEIETWYKKLSLLSDTIDEWVVVQKAWMYLETIFSAEDIKKQLPEESKKFSIVDKTFKSLMRKTAKKPLVLECVSMGRKTLTSLQQATAMLEDIQRCLEEYLETKRAAFPRFYFLSNDELLEILSQTRDPSAVQPHMPKCFDAINVLIFGDEDENQNCMYGMISGGKAEKVMFTEHVEAEGSVEYWMSKIEAMMCKTLYNETKASYQAYPVDNPVDRAEWLFASPAMVVLVVDQIYFSRAAEDTFKAMKDNPKAMNEFYENYVVKQIEYMVRMVRGKLTSLQRTLMGAILTIDVHGREVVKDLMAKNVKDANEFGWNKQLRYYWVHDEDNVYIRQTNTEFLYAYEYLGNGMRLVITPLTDIIYMTLTGAVHLKFGGAPAGPAGTGKTETTKDLAKALAINCVVFNCSDGLDYKIMGRFFSGLVQSGAWSCFDEFNRIDIEVLSVIAQQILTIQRAIIQGVSNFEFEGKTIKKGDNFGVFITMNPGYAGRTELPDNLAALFRPVACMVPDYRMIAEIILFSFGFAGAFPLSNKMSQLYKLSSEQLSKQDHYDFGMRAVKTVLVCAGQLKRKEPDQREDLLLIRAMRDSNVPKFLERDLPLFAGIIKDLFPGEKVPFVDYGKLQLAIENQLRLGNYQVVPSLVSKIIQVHETQLVRHGMMIVGQNGSGKTVNVTVLAKAIQQLKEDGVVDKDDFFQLVKTITLNPKAITAGELYGQFNDMSGEWFDGVVPKSVRECVAERTPRRKWIIFDGPVDAVWIENMNTVLDDNKTLCLANSERIKLSAQMHMMFEVEDLSVASPATVSRCGMVFMEQVHVGTTCLMDSWLTTSLAETFGPYMEILVSLMKEHAQKVIDYVLDFTKSKLPTSMINLASSLIHLTESVMIKNKKKVLAHENQKERLCKYLFAFTMTWSLGGNCDDASRKLFDEFLAENVLPSLLDPEDVPKSMYDVSLDVAGIRFVSWTYVRKEFIFPTGASFFDIMVPTADTTRYTYVLDALLKAGYHTLLMGESGVGKSVIVQQYLNATVAPEDSKFVTATSNYSAQTTPKNLRIFFESKLEKKRKTLLGPPAGTTMLCFIDDLNMPALEFYGAQPPNELLRQVIDNGGYYDTDKLFLKNVANTTFVSACAPPGGGRNPVSGRLLRHFNMIWMTNLSAQSMITIFKAIGQGYFESEFPELAELAGGLALASVQAYEIVTEKLLPTPKKSHYTFNLRDLSKVFQGILMTKRNELSEGEPQLVRLWFHEQFRVFRDRLVNHTDRKWFSELCSTCLEPHVTDIEGVVVDSEKVYNIMFGDFLQREEKVYQEITAPEKLPDFLTETLEEYNITYPTQMHLVFFQDAILHCARISRVLAQPRGNALLVGVGGSGRKSLANLASFLANCKTISIEITRGYGMNEWREDLKKLLMTAGAENKKVVFLFSDTQVVNEGFLEDINNILNSGDVPNLYEQDELERIVNLVRPLCKQRGIIDTRDNVVACYIDNVRNNLHVVLAFSPVGSAFRERCRRFPSLVNCCTIDWFDPWPEDALFSVAHKFLSADRKGNIGAYVEPLCKICVKIHREVEQRTTEFLQQNGRYNYTTPTSYLELIKLYLEKMQEQNKIVSDKAARYKGGLKKLMDAEETVAKLKVQLTALQPTLEKAEVDVGNFMKQLEVDQKNADEAKGIAAIDEAAAMKVAEEVQAMKDDCQRDLDEALPAYYKAMKALDKLDKTAIQEVKAFANPPALVQTTLEAVCIMMGSKTSWKDAKALMSQMDFLDQLKKYDKDNISAKKIKKLKKYIDMPDFNEDKMKTISSAATCLCAWCHAMYIYNKVAKEVAPKRAQLAEAETKLAATMADLKQKQDQLKTIIDRLKELQKQFDAAVHKKENLKRQQEDTANKLVRAEKLTSGLADEKVRWGQLANQLESIDLPQLVGNMVISAGCVAYVGPFTADYRRSMVVSWIHACQKLEIPVSPTFTLQNALADPVELRQWAQWGLPADDFSIQNGMFAKLGRRWPLMIDPQGQANSWTKNMYRETLQVCKLSESNFLRTLENGIRFGKPVLLENVQEELDPGLEPVLLKQVFKRGGQMVLRLGDTDVPYSNEFKFFITTKIANPHYMPEVCIKVTIINFTVTPSGLEDQLLVDVVQNERPDLEQRKDELTVAIANDQKELKRLEDSILHMLATSKGNILDDEGLINNLAQSKVTAVAIAGRLKEAEQTSKEINHARESYRIVANRGSVLYFVIASLGSVDTMYQYSLAFFKNVYNKRIKMATRSDVLEERLTILLNDITSSMYTNVCRGLFEQHKLLYAFTIAVMIGIDKKDIKKDWWNAFLVGIGKCERDAEKCPTPQPWISNNMWTDTLRLDYLDGLEGFSDSFLKNLPFWHKFVTCDEPHKLTLPKPWDEKHGFLQMVIMRTYRREKIFFKVTDFVANNLGDKFTKSPAFDLTAAFNTSTCQTPLIFILSAGADVNDALISLAQANGKDGEFLKIVSLGQGQGPKAEALMENGKQAGHWVCLQNCHLSISWLPTLQEILETMAQEEINPEYRLWLTSMPSNKFPVSILQNGVKITNEPPKGLKANLTGTFSTMTDEYYEESTNPRAWKKLLFATAFYNAISLERKKFGAIGWNIQYPWMNSDLKTAFMMVKNYLELGGAGSAVPWETLNTMVGVICYGGRVTDSWDKRCNINVLQRYYVPELLEDGFDLADGAASGIYQAPPAGSLADMRAYIDNLPHNDIPEAFGLHPNANIEYENKQVRSLLQTLILMEGGGSGSGGDDAKTEAIVMQMAEDMQARMPEKSTPFHERDAHESTFAKLDDGSVVSLGVFLSQEMSRFNDLVAVVSKSLVDLKRAIKGLIVMSGPLEEMFKCFVFQQIPPVWEAVAFPSLKPLAAWQADFFKRLKMVKEWLLTGPPNCFWIPGFFFPQGFMTAVLQTHARKTEIPIDTLSFKTRMTDRWSSQVESSPEHGAYMYGLYMQGARFDAENMKMAESKPTELFAEVPAIHLDPCVTAEKKYNHGIYSCPVYKTSRRAGTLSTTGHSTNFVVPLEIPSDKPEMHWIREGTAMLCMLDY